MLALLIAVAGAHHRASQHTRSGAANERSMSYSHPINARHVVMGVFVLAGFAFVLLQLPLDSNPAMPSLRAIQENKEEKRATSILGSIDHNELVVLLSDITPISLSHDGAGARKQVGRLCEYLSCAKNWPTEYPCTAVPFFALSYQYENSFNKVIPSQGVPCKER